MYLNITSMVNGNPMQVTHSLTNAAPAKPYLQVVSSNTTGYLPLYAANSSVAGPRLAVTSGTSTYRAKHYVTTTVRSNYNTTSVGPGNMSSTTALTVLTVTKTTPITTKTTTSTSYHTTATVTSTSPVTASTTTNTKSETTKTTTSTSPITASTTTNTSKHTTKTTTGQTPRTAKTTTKTGTVTDYTSQTKTSYSIELWRSSYRGSGNITSQSLVYFIENANQTFTQFRPFGVEATKIRNNIVELSMTTSYTSLVSRCSSGSYKMIMGTTEQIIGTGEANVNTLPNKVISALSSKNARPWHTSVDSYSKYVIIGSKTESKQGIIHAHSSSSAFDGTWGIHWFTDITYLEDLLGQTRNTYGTTVTTTGYDYGTTTTLTKTTPMTTKTTTNTSYHTTATVTKTTPVTTKTTTNTASHTTKTTTTTSPLTASTTTNTSSHKTTTTTGYSGVSSRTSASNTWA